MFRFKKRVCFMLLMLCLPALLWADETITGRVTDVKTGEPVVGAVVFSGNVGATTDANGEFNLKSVEPVKNVTVRLIGYETATVAFAGKALRIQLQPSAVLLGEVVVTAFESKRRQIETPAAVALLTPRDLQRGDKSSIIPVINQIPGVRVDYYTIGDYRLSIRGSALAAPSVHGGGYKVYWNDIPFSKASGGNAIGRFDVNALGNLEVIRGPGSSLYGAGFGGVLLLSAQQAENNQSSADVDAMLGSDGLERVTATAKFATQNANIFAQFTNLDYDGYRQLTFSRAKYATLGAQIYHNERVTSSLLATYDFRTIGIGGDLDSAQAAQDPRQALTIPPAGFGPKQYSLGYNNRYRVHARWSNSFSVNYNDNYGGRFVMVFPFFGIYAKEPNRSFALRNTLTHHGQWGSVAAKIVTGVEYLSAIDEAEDFNGPFDDPASEVTERRKDRTNAAIGFLQAEFAFPQNWIVTAGASYNNYDYVLESFINPERFEQSTNNISPRLSLLKNWNDRVSAYASFSYGFTPPQGGQFSDFRNIDGTFNKYLQSSVGTNLEAGLKFNSANRKLYGEAIGYRFFIDDAIIPVLVPVSAGVDVERKENAGKVEQLGFEATLGYNFINAGKGAVRDASLRLSYTYNDFTYDNYQTYRSFGFPPSTVAVDFSGKTVPGTVPHNLFAALDLDFKPGLYANAALYYYSAQFLNDANTDAYDGYALLNVKAGCKRRVFGDLALHVYGGINNVLDTQYSGLLAYNSSFGYFNPAPGINYFAGVGLTQALGK